MATWDEVRALALALPETVEVMRGLGPKWLVRDKMFAWERPLRPRDLEELGAEAAGWVVLGVRVPMHLREALIAEEPDVYFATAHFDGYPAVLVRLDRIGTDALRELLAEAWLDRAPKTLARRASGKDPFHLE